MITRTPERSRYERALRCRPSQATSHADIASRHDPGWTCCKFNHDSPVCKHIVPPQETRCIWTLVDTVLDVVVQVSDHRDAIRQLVSARFSERAYLQQSLLDVRVLLSTASEDQVSELTAAALLIPPLSALALLSPLRPPLYCRATTIHGD